jgi:hypothetical protein
LNAPKPRPLSLFPGFLFDGDSVRIVRSETRRPDGRGARVVAHLRGRGDVAMSTDEIMALTTRGK